MSLPLLFAPSRGDPNSSEPVYDKKKSFTPLFSAYHKGVEEIREEMKVERLELLPAPRLRKVSSFLVVEEAHEHGDAVYVGTEQGLLSVYFLPPHGHSMRKIRAEDLGLEDEVVNPRLHHSSKVTVLLHTKNPKLSSTSSYGLLFSGSSDRTVRVWNLKTLVQSLPHSATVTGLCDGNDGSVVTICIDGILKVWAPQKGRHMMLHPFFECTFNLSVLDSKETSWSSALAISSWGAFVGGFDGSISLFRKNNTDSGDIEERIASNSCPLVRRKRWEHVHAIGITHLQVLPEEGLLIALASNGCCKILDAIIGATLITFINPRKCAYTGMSWSEALSTLTLSDELGFLQTYNVGKEKDIGCVQLAKPSRKQLSKISSSHEEQSLGGVVAYRNPHTFFALLMPYSTKTVHATLSTNTLAKPKHDNNEDLASYGGVALIRIVAETKILEFVGHDGPVVGISINPAGYESDSGGIGGVFESERIAHDQANFERQMIAPSKASNAAKSLKSTDTDSIKTGNSTRVLRVSKEESAFFSTGTDFTIRCWDDLDATESYQFRSKISSEFTAMKMLWNMNSIVSGHENGMLVLWNSDAGTHVSSRALQNSITCIIDARRSRSHLLVASDFSGRIALWNLTQFRINPAKLPVESVFQSNHDPAEPGVLSIAFHKNSDTFFSGGVDRSIKLWKLNVEITNSLNAHSESVCCLECTDNYLLSGDESGEIILWLIKLPEGLGGENMVATAASLTPKVSPLCKWFCSKDEPSRAIVSLHVVSIEKLIVVQAGAAGKTFIWDVYLQQRTGNEANSCYAEHKKNPGKVVIQENKDIGKDASLLNLPINAESLVEDGHPTDSLSGVSELSLSEEAFSVCRDAITDTRVSVFKFIEVQHSSEFEASCVQLLCNEMGVPRYLYLGSNAGIIQRIEVIQ